MAKETTKKKETASKTESLVKREYTEEEKASIFKFQELAKRKPVKFKEVKGEPGKLNIDFEYPEGQLRQVKISEAFGTADPDLQGHLLEQVLQTFKGTVSTDAPDNKVALAALNKTMAILSGILLQNLTSVANWIGLKHLLMAVLLLQKKEQIRQKDQTRQGNEVDGSGRRPI